MKRSELGHTEETIISKVRSCIKSGQEFRIAVFTFNHRQAKELFSLVQDKLKFPKVNVSALKLMDESGNYVVFLSAESKDKLMGRHITNGVFYEDISTHLSYEEEFELTKFVLSRIRQE